jgi:hypothetical protein
MIMMSNRQNKKQQPGSLLEYTNIILSERKW